ncbi:MAG: tRNA (adenosine(37)-N6)-dimethylallyltransferase MiaA [Muribaculaceae bacterium]|nr:tRNA (adenosine(37)-N6)-dimethylallyltransferase MiaA [Muribaculaceae bacterium]
MNRFNRPLLIVITGPTASGKSALAVSLALRLGAEVISSDSRQIYHGIPIVTATPTPEEMCGVTHHLIDVLPLDAYYSASEFEQDALRIARRQFEECGVAVVCGGSMMYVDALCNGIDDLPTVPEEIRSGLMEEWKEKGDAWLLERLALLDSAHYANVDKKNMKRVFHAVEISMTAGVPYSSLVTGKKKERDFNILKICLDGAREKLFARINSRVDKMVEIGLEEEARGVYHLRHLNSLNTVGLKEMFAWFDGVFTKDEAISRIKKNTRVYAKKQLTWYKRDPDMMRLDFEDGIECNTEKIITLAGRYPGNMS